MRSLTLEGTMVVFKTLEISKTAFPKSPTEIPYQVIKELEKTQKSILWEISTLKIKDETACKDYKVGGLWQKLIYHTKS